MFRTFAAIRASAAALAAERPPARPARFSRGLAADAAAAADNRELTRDHPASQRTTPGVGGARQEHQPELADLHLVSAGEIGRVDALAVEVGAVEAADVPHGEALGVRRAQELGMPAGDCHVVEEDVALRV